MSERKPDKREQARIDKRNRGEESRRARVLIEIESGRSLRAAGTAVGRSHDYAMYWRDIAMEKRSHRKPNGERVPVYVKKKGWKTLIRVKRPGPPKGSSVKSHLFREKAIEVKKKYPRMGCRKLTILGGLDISGPTMCGILKSQGMIEPKKKAKFKGKRFRASRPNEMWQIDYVDLGHGSHLLSVMDDHSGKVFSSDIRKTMTTDDVLEIMNECFSRHGVPDAILSDHGVQWYATKGGDSRFDEMCMSRSIKHIMGRINHPQTQGKVERFHRSLKDETDIKAFEDPEEKRKAMDEYLIFYNTVRPHWGIGLRTPDSVYYSGIPV